MKKKIFSIVALFAFVMVTVVALTGCGAQKTIVGDWEYTGGGYVYHFEADGTGNYCGSMTLTYKEDNGNVEILYDGWTEPLKATWKDDVLTVKDSFDNDTVYNRK